MCKGRSSNIRDLPIKDTNMVTDRSISYVIAAIAPIAQVEKFSRLKPNNQL